MLKAIGHYQIRRKIGEGAMGTVYEGWDDRLERPVAVKTILEAPESKEARSRLWREARSLARVNHPNVCQVFDVLEEGESLVLIIGIARRPVHGGPPSHGHGYDLGSAGD